MWFQIRIEDLSSLAIRCTDGLRSQMTAAGAAFHRRGPACLNPVPREEQIGPRRDCARTKRVDAGRHAERGADFLEERDLFELGFIHRGKEFSKFAECLRDGFLARKSGEGACGRDDKLNIIAGPPLQYRLVI